MRQRRASSSESPTEASVCTKCSARLGFDADARSSRMTYWRTLGGASSHVEISWGRARIRTRTRVRVRVRTR